MDSTTNSVHGRFTIKALPHAQAPGSLTEFSTVVNSSQPNQTAPAIIRIPPGTSNSLPTGDDTAVVSVHGSYTFASDGTIIIDTFPNGVEVITNPDPQSPECVQVFNTMGTLSKVNYKSLDACMVEIKVNPAGKKVSMLHVSSSNNPLDLKHVTKGSIVTASAQFSFIDPKEQSLLHFDSLGHVKVLLNGKFDFKGSPGSVFGPAGAGGGRTSDEDIQVVSIVPANPPTARRLPASFKTPSATRPVLSRPPSLSPSAPSVGRAPMGRTHNRVVSAPSSSSASGSRAHSSHSAAVVPNTPRRQRRHISPTPPRQAPATSSMTVFPGAMHGGMMQGGMLGYGGMPMMQGAMMPNGMMVPQAGMLFSPQAMMQQAQPEPSFGDQYESADDEGPALVSGTRGVKRAREDTAQSEEEEEDEGEDGGVAEGSVYEDEDQPARKRSRRSDASA